MVFVHGGSFMVVRKGKRMQQVGLPPGSLVHVGEQKLEKPTMTVLDYDEQGLEEVVVKEVSQCEAYVKSATTTWLNVDGIHQVSLVEQLGKYFSIHPLTLEDIVDTNQRPKMELDPGYVFLVLKMVRFDDQNQLIIEQVSFVLGKTFVLSFQESQGDVFQPIRDRIRTSKGRIRKSGSDYLTYALVDAIVDHYFVVLEHFGEELEELQDRALEDPSPQTMEQIQHMKRQMITIRKSIWPLREVVNGLLREETPLIQKSTKVFLRDVYDHAIQVIDTIETYRDILSSVTEIYISSMSNRMNEIMKVLTIFASIFIPLTFIAGIYGMNFQHMPELTWKWGYPLVWLSFGVITVSLLLFFRKRKWL